MKRTAITDIPLLFCSLVLLCVPISVAAESPATAVLDDTPLPQLVAPVTVYDFGSVSQGTPVEHRFDIKNTGPGVLKIERMHTSCGCTAAVLDSDTIQPGASTQVKVSFDTTGFQGTKIKTVRLYTNDPKQASVLFTIQGTIHPDVELSVPRLNFGDLRKGQTQVIKVALTMAKGSNIQVTETSSRSPYLDVSSEEIRDNTHSGKRLIVKLKDSLPVGVFHDRIVVKTTSSINPVINIPVFARIVGDLRLNPATVSFGLVEGPLQAPLSQTVKVENVTGAPVRIKELKSDNPSILAELIPAKDAKSSLIKVTIREDLTGAFRSKITVTTDNADANQQELSLPVYGIISRESK